MGFEPFSERHEPFVWAAYKRGSLDFVEPDLNESAFVRLLDNYIEEAKEDGYKFWAVMASVPRHGIIPVGVVNVRFNEQIASPHVDWFPEATPRTKIEAGVKLIWDLKTRSMVIITGPEENEPYWRHLSHYGLLRRVGVFRDYYGKDQHASCFQSVGH